MECRLTYEVQALLMCYMYRLVNSVYALNQLLNGDTFVLNILF